MSGAETAALALSRIGEPAVWAWLREHWEFFAGTGIGILLSILTVLYQRQPKRLDYQILSDLRLLSPPTPELGEELKVTYRGEPVEDPRIVVVRVMNSGKISISDEDFAGGDPVRIRYGKNPPTFAKIVGASKGLSTERLSSTLRQISEQGPDLGVVEVTPGLLNRKDWFDIQLASNQTHGDISVTARFADQHRPMRRLATGETAESFASKSAAGIGATMAVFLGLSFDMLGLFGPDPTTIETPGGPIVIAEDPIFSDLTQAFLVLPLALILTTIVHRLLRQRPTDS